MNNKINYNKSIKMIALNDKVKYEEKKKLFDRKCKRCGYTNRILNKYKKIPCKNCGYYVFLNEKEEFKYRIKEIL